MRGMLPIRLLMTLVACAATSLIAAAPAAAQGSYSPYDETPAAALARYIHALADDPKDFTALIGAGRAALELGDPQAAAGFFARADEVNPRSPDPQAGMGAVSVATGEARAALPYFKRAQQLGAPASALACSRGLAYDLLGQQALAQADYRLALAGRDADEASRRLALSLAISGNRAAALQALSPLLAKRDAGAGRVRAFVLALTGDSSGAMAAADAAMPGSWSSVGPFLKRLPTLGAGQKAAAVNLGVFPDASSSGYASVASAPQQPPTSRAQTSRTQTSRAGASIDGSRLAGVDALLREPSSAAVQATQPSSSPWAVPTAPATQVSYAAPAQALQQQSRIWLQLATGPNPEALPDKFEKLKHRYRELFDGIPGYVATGADRVRLVIGPFHSSRDADIFAEDLESVNVAAFRWTNSPSDRIVPLRTE